MQSIITSYHIPPSGYPSMSFLLHFNESCACNNSYPSSLARASEFQVPTHFTINFQPRPINFQAYYLLYQNYTNYTSHSIYCYTKNSKKPSPLHNTKNHFTQKIIIIQTTAPGIPMWSPTMVLTRRHLG